MVRVERGGKVNARIGWLHRLLAFGRLNAAAVRLRRGNVALTGNEIRVAGFRIQNAARNRVLIRRRGARKHLAVRKPNAGKSRRSCGIVRSVGRIQFTGRAVKFHANNDDDENEQNSEKNVLVRLLLILFESLLPPE